MGRREREEQAAVEWFGRGYWAAAAEVERFYDEVRRKVRRAAAREHGDWIEGLAEAFAAESDHIIALMVRLEAARVVTDEILDRHDDEDDE